VATRRSQGEGGVHWSAREKRWVATAQLGFRPNGKRVVRTATGQTKTEAKNRLKDLLRDKDDGFTSSTRLSVADAVEEWLKFGLSGRSASTVSTCSTLTRTHIIPELGARKLQDLSADDVDRWLATKSHTLSTATLQRLLSILRRAIAREQARDGVRRNVAMLCGVPTGTQGRPSKSLNLKQARAVLEASKGAPLRAYIVLSLLTGARTEELRALTWAHVDLIGRSGEDPPKPPSMELWRSVREGATRRLASHGAP
jgi:integrase